MAGAVFECSFVRKNPGQNVSLVHAGCKRCKKAKVLRIVLLVKEFGKNLPIVCDGRNQDFIVRTITDTLLQFPAPKISHVTGHEDKETPYAELPLRAQLNVDALATLPVTSTPPSRPRSNPTQLPSDTITSKIKPVVRKPAPTSQTLQEYGM
jgi:hypothetical protein